METRRNIAAGLAMKPTHWDQLMGQRTKILAAGVLFLWLGFCGPCPVCTFAQESPPMIEEAAPQTLATPAAQEVPPSARSNTKGLNLFDLLRRGGWFMVPLGLLSILVVALTVERFLALREARILPRGLVKELGALSRQEAAFDPREAFRICQSFPSSASRVLRIMLLKAGRPQAEVEHAVAEAAEREATRLQATVSWLTLAAAVAPLIGLLGTVWGMIQAFYDTTQLVAGQNKAEVLAQGIYTALVTTLSGLIIAIPSAVLAHYFDNRIVGWFHKIEELAISLTPMMEQFEGKIRVTASDENWSSRDTSADKKDDTASSDIGPSPNPR